MAAKEITGRALGKVWTFGRADAGVMEELLEWIRQQEGDQFEDLDKHGALLSQEARDAIFKERLARRDQLRCLTLRSPLAQQYMATPKGFTMMALMLLRPKHPDIDEKTAFEVMQDLDPETTKKLVAKAESEMAPKNGEAPAAVPGEKSTGVKLHALGSKSDEG